MTKVEKRTRVNEEKKTQRWRKKERETVNENREWKKGPGIAKRRIFQKGARENSWKNREDVFIQVLLTSEWDIPASCLNAISNEIGAAEVEKIWKGSRTWSRENVNKEGTERSWTKWGDLICMVICLDLIGSNYDCLKWLFCERFYLRGRKRKWYRVAHDETVVFKRKEKM